MKNPNPPPGVIIRNVDIATANPDIPSAYGAIKQAALVIEQGLIRWVGPEKKLPDHYHHLPDHDGQRHWLTPGLIDCHTHLVFAGNRIQEAQQRLQGQSYAQIARQGGGIAATVRATRQASRQTLLELACQRAQVFMAEGVTTMEIKSGYGLELATERRQLEVAREIERQLPLTITTTFLGAHSLPDAFQNDGDGYIHHLCRDILPTLARAGLVDAVDGFCDPLAFSTDQIRPLFMTARHHGLPVKLHAEQLSLCGGSLLAAEFQALSADHLEYLDPQGIQALARAGTVATLLPGACYQLRESRYPPVAALRAAGVPMALASDFNPGSSPLASLRLMMHMACTLFGLTPEEALLGVTRHGAQALGLADRGQVRAGYRADLVLWPMEHPAELACHFGLPAPAQIIKDGEWL